MRPFASGAITVLLIEALLFFGVGTGLGQRQKQGADAILQLEADFMKATTEKGSQGYISYYADDAVELPNGAGAIRGKANIAKTMSFLDEKDNRLTWKPEFADLSGDLSYTWGTFEFSSKGEDGKATVERGKYMTVWKKQKDGSWKVAVDMGNSSPGPKS